MTCDILADGACAEVSTDWDLTLPGMGRDCARGRFFLAMTGWGDGPAASGWGAHLWRRLDKRAEMRLGVGVRMSLRSVIIAAMIMIPLESGRRRVTT